METIKIQTKEDLIELLTRHHVPFETWGTGGSKTLDHLFSELISGESSFDETNRLSESKQIHGLVRNVISVGIDVFFKDENGLHKLIEEKQIFNDGRIRERKLETSVSEKIKPKERPINAAARAFREELKILISPQKFIEKNVVARAPALSESFPGLISRRTVYHYKIFLPKKDCKPEGYVEKQKDKSTYFVWKKILK